MIYKLIEPYLFTASRSKSFISTCCSEESCSQSSNCRPVVSLYSVYLPNYLWAILCTVKQLPSCGLPPIFLGASSDLPQNFLGTSSSFINLTTSSEEVSTSSEGPLKRPHLSLPTLRTSLPSSDVAIGPLVEPSLPRARLGAPWDGGINPGLA